MFASYPIRPRPRSPVVDLHFSIAHTFEPCAILVIVRGVHDHEIIIPAAAIDERVVDHVRIGREEMRIQRLARQQPAAVIAADRIEERSRIRAAHIVHAHVTDIEQARRIARGKMFLEHPVYCTGISQPANGRPSAAAGFMDIEQLRAPLSDLPPLVRPKKEGKGVVLILRPTGWIPINQGLSSRCTAFPRGSALGAWTVMAISPSSPQRQTAQAFSSR